MARKQRNQKRNNLNLTEKDRGSILFELSADMFGGYPADSSEAGSVLLEIGSTEVTLYRMGFAHNICRKDMDKIVEIMENADEEMVITDFLPYNDLGLSSEAPGTNKAHFVSPQHSSMIASAYRGSTSFKGAPLTKFNSVDERDVQLINRESQDNTDG